MASALHVVRSGTGPLVLLVHGSAADSSTWSIQLASSLRNRLTLVVYDRRGTGASAGDGQIPQTIEAHADDAAELIRELGAPVTLVGSSFGAVIVLDVLRRYPGLARGAVLIEPPMAAADGATVGPGDFVASLDALAEREGPEAAAEVFLRVVLGEAAFARTPVSYRKRSTKLWPQIRADSLALAGYRPRYGELGAVTTPVLLLGGERSAPTFRPTLEALARALPNARLEIVKGAGHMLHAEAFRTFGTLLLQVAGAPPSDAV